MDASNPQRQHSCLIIKRINKYQTKEKSGLYIEVWLLHFIYICRLYMDSTRYRDAILNSSAIWKYVILLSLEQGVLISLEYALLINHPYEYPFRAPQHSQSKGHINKKEKTEASSPYYQITMLPFHCCTPTGNRTRIYSLGESCSIH